MLQEVLFLSCVREHRAVSEDTATSTTAEWKNLFLDRRLSFEGGGGAKGSDNNKEATRKSNIAFSPLNDPGSETYN